MKTRISLLTLLLLMVLSLSCSNDDDQGTATQEVQLLFGPYVGLVPGNDYSDIYLLDGSSLYKDTLGNYPSDGFYEGEYVELSEADFQIARDLISFFPSELFQENENYVGCPDCADQGGIYVEYESPTRRGFWNIDVNKGDLPEYLHEFVDKISETIIQLNY